MPRRRSVLGASLTACLLACLAGCGATDGGVRADSRRARCTSTAPG
ncbi:hypothetical protein ACFYXF_13360 [Streptomyces sp. NPDC002680]